MENKGLPNILGALYMISIFFISGCSNGNISNVDTIPGAQISYGQETSLSPAPTDTMSEAASETSTKWLYSTDENKMTSDDVQYASIEANELLEFDFPYNGGSTATFIVRKKEGRTDLLLQVSKGQFITGIGENNTLRIRFDNEKAFRVSYDEPSDYSHTTIFIESVSTILSKLRKAKRMRIEVGFYNEGERVIEFDVAGFTWGSKKKN